MTATDFLEVDYRTEPTERLPELLNKTLDTTDCPAVLWTARRPRKRWHNGLSDWTPLVLSSAPQFELILWLSPAVETRVPEELQKESDYLLNAYHALFQGESDIANCPHWLKYRNTLSGHIRRQETNSYPALLKKLPLDRAIREVGYEHRGLEKGLQSLPRFLERARKGELEGKEREKLDLDFYHLLEHHVEREAEAIYPAMVFSQGVDR